ncbi:murinoglobulin-1-like [Chironomus tepperi]|uniref:murinoglobulin-1-like n=1 Tax=Chironomus tepperi TaxID=113505 RepID=UPI00391F48FA
MTNSDTHSRFMTSISGDYINSDINSEFQHYPASSLDQVTSMLKANVEVLRYLKSNHPQQPKTGFSEYYQSILNQKSKNWDHKDTAGYKAYFVDTIASAMELGAIPESKEIIKKELDALKSFQTSSGNFSNFGNFPSTNNEYSKTAFILIPFLKFKTTFSNGYDDVINKAFTFLNGINSESEVDMETLSIAAFSYALNGQHDQAQKLLDEAENNAVKIGSKRCFKLSRNQWNCNLRHTSYAALAYLTMNKTDEAKPLVSYILGEYRMLKSLRHTFNYAIATEVIAKLLIIRQKSALKTDLTVTLPMEYNFNGHARITEANNKNPVEVVFPHNISQLKITINGTGFCSITNIIENTVVTPKKSSKFITSVETLNGSYSNEEIVQVCATYQPLYYEDGHNLFSVIYDVEMPSGYFYKGINNMDNNPAIKLVEPKMLASGVQIYLSNFESGRKYCADIKAVKMFDVRNLQNAAVMIYDYDDKENVAVDFYKF